ncbi:DUF6844 domain-containing protein [Parendozoicomonas haliclonae]|uniref:DUF6844 domain-containing protein n=1 Tax=Parendozoicomonas haliclonae TaxID=1960125 RepID=A0A1X7AKY0_9GAMM|nr:hypothetical protein [Parendozoicomonas haliclonae]SMA48329.1 hypothetical protein EHSB41UT_02697 [Parendozoicomonas haliclonae]
MEFRKKATVVAVTCALSTLFILPVVKAESQPAPVVSAASDVTDMAQPAQTTQEVVAAAEAGVDDAMADVDQKAQHLVNKQKAVLLKAGRKDVRIMYGTALINAKPADSGWGDARVIAYQRAVMAAREKLLKQLYTEVSSEMLRENFRTNQLPQFSEEELQNQVRMDALLDVVVAVADTALDGRIEKMGIDSSAYKNANPSKRKVMMKKAFSKSTSRMSEGELSGTVVTKTYETTDSNGNTAVAVVLSTSNKMKNTLENLQLSKGNINPDPAKARMPIADYLEKNRGNLMYQYGLNLIYDEQGYPVLISFAQAGNDCNPVDYDECVDNREFAFIEAENDAYSHFAEAYNLVGKLQTSTTKGEEKIKDATITKTEEGMDTTEGTVSRIIKETRQLSEQRSSVKDLVGIQEEMRWTEKHPVTGREINGLVLTWHPVNEQSIRAFKSNKPEPQPQTQSPRQPSSAASVNQGAGMDTFDASDF